MADPFLIIEDPYEGLGFHATWEQHKTQGSFGEDRKNTKTQAHTAPSDGIVTYVGGTYHEVVVQMINGQYWRTAEIAVIDPKIVKGAHVSRRQVIGTGAYVRGGIARGAHQNGIDGAGRKQFTKMVTHTKAAADAAAKAAAPSPRSRTTLPDGANVRSSAAITATNKVSALKGNWTYEMDGWLRGGPANGSDVWFHCGFGYVHSSAFTDKSTANLPDLNPVVVPPVVVPPVVVPPVVVPPVPEIFNEQQLAQLRIVVEEVLAKKKITIEVKQ
jgi:hypothetical protein